MTPKRESRKAVTAVRARMEEHILACVLRGRHYLCADEIATDLGLSAQFVGSQLSILKTESKLLDIAIWSHSRHAVWKFSLKSPEALVPVQQNPLEKCLP